MDISWNRNAAAVEKVGPDLFLLIFPQVAIEYSLEIHLDHKRKEFRNNHKRSMNWSLHLKNM